MPATQIRWSTLFKLTELDFIPEAPSVLKVSDEMVQAISWLTGATGHDRRLLRCTDDGALLVADAWSNYTAVESDELYPQSGTNDTATASVPNCGVLVATSGQLIKAVFYRFYGGPGETIYIPANYEYWYSGSTYAVTVFVVPDPDGTASYVGITTFN